MVKKNYIYRARGTYKATGRRVWVTDSWNEERALAKIELTNTRFKDVEIIREDEFAMQRAGKNPKIMRRI